MSRMLANTPRARCSWYYEKLFTSKMLVVLWDASGTIYENLEVR
ncbi:hypothetical protein [Thermodesulfobium sp.]